jgi:hypothetical protein
MAQRKIALGKLLFVIFLFFVLTAQTCDTVDHSISQYTYEAPTPWVNTDIYCKSVPVWNQSTNQWDYLMVCN